MKKATIYVLLLIAGIALVSYILYGFRKIEPAPVVIETPQVQPVEDTQQEKQAIINNEVHSKD